MSRTTASGSPAPSLHVQKIYRLSEKLEAIGDDIRISR
jgi:hypothetical protein